MEHRVELLLQELIDYQRKRVLAKANEIDPRLTEDDILQPHDVEKLSSNPSWNYEDGVLAGYCSAQIAIRSFFRKEEG